MQSTFQLFSVLLNWSKGVKRSRSTFIFAALTGAIAGFGSTVLIAVINQVLSHGPSLKLIWAFVALCILIPISGFVSQALLVRMTAQAARDMRMRLSRQILGAPYRLLEELGIHRLLATITDDIPSVTTGITSLPLLATQFAVIAGCLVYLGWLSWPLLLLVLGYMVLGILTYQLPTMKSVHHFRMMREGWDASFKGFRALTEGTKELKLNRDRRNAFLSQELEPAVEGVYRHGVIANTIALAASNWGQILFFVFIGLILFLTPVLVNVSRQALMGYTLTVLFMISPLSTVLNTLPILGKAHVAAEKVNALGLTLATHEPEGAVSARAGASWRTLDLTGVTHVYRTEGSTDEFLLGPLDISLRPGEIVFLIGGNGSGKTTLAKLLIGLYEPTRGTIMLDSEGITRDNRDDYRQLFSVVFYDFYLFDRLYGVAQHDLEARSRKYLAQLQLTQKLHIENGKLSTTELSQGQRKRLALLTAYLEDRPIYVFDEWASDQDPMFKQIFYYEILPDLKTRGKTVIVISHDDRYYSAADRIIKMERGQIEYDRRIEARMEIPATAV
jgi:putative ATP-binding cassette transporter